LATHPDLVVVGVEAQGGVGLLVGQGEPLVREEAQRLVGLLASWPEPRIQVSEALVVVWVLVARREATKPTLALRA
jgi:hypothetical protein